jgi:N-acetylglucosamine-6-sulfatase
MFSGQYQHNHQTLNNSVSGGCSGPYWQQHVEPQAWPALLHQAGYTTFYAGKYLNQVSVRTHLHLVLF